MDLVRVRCAKPIDLRFVILSDGVDHECVAALVMADGLPIPSAPRIFRMGHVQIDEPSLAVPRVEDYDLCGCLQNPNSRTASIQNHGHTRRLAKPLVLEMRDAAQL